MRREVVVTLTVEHDSGPYRDDHWEQSVPAAIEAALREMDTLTVGRSSGYRIVDAVVDDVLEAGVAR